MKYLVIDTSGVHLTVLVKTEDKVINKFTLDCGLKHSITLMPTIESVLDELNIKISDIDVFGCVVGPGSFTGIRIGVSTIKAFSYAFNKKVLSVTSFDLLAYNSNEENKLAVIDANHQNYYVCGYDKNNNIIMEAKFIEFDELKELSKEYKILASNKIDGVNTIICDIKQGLYNVVESKIKKATFDKESIVPLYIKKSQAEENA